MRRVSVTFVVALFASLAVQTGLANAGPIQIVGNAQGCFGIACTPDEADSVDLGGVNLTYSSLLPVDFSGATEDDFLAINTATTGNFGSLSVGTASPRQTIATPFTLLVSFLNPVVSAQAVFNASISGTVSLLASGGVLVDFDPDLVTLAFQDALTNQAGTLDILVFGTAIASGGQGALTGFIETSVQPVPEPATLLLMGAGVAALARRRYRAAN